MPMVVEADAGDGRAAANEQISAAISARRARDTGTPLGESRASEPSLPGTVLVAGYTPLWGMRSNPSAGHSSIPRTGDVPGNRAPAAALLHECVRADDFASARPGHREAA